jgi:TonB family protein
MYPTRKKTTAATVPLVCGSCLEKFMSIMVLLTLAFMIGQLLAAASAPSGKSHGAPSSMRNCTGLDNPYNSGEDEIQQFGSDSRYGGLIPMPADEPITGRASAVDTGDIPSMGEKSAGGRGESGRMHDRSPELVWMVWPEYPPEAKKSGIDGRVVLDILVEPDGRPAEISVVEEIPSGYGFGESSVKAARSSIFKPAVKKSGRVQCHIYLPIEFGPEDDN